MLVEWEPLTSLHAAGCIHTNQPNRKLRDIEQCALCFDQLSIGSIVGAPCSRDLSHLLCADCQMSILRQTLPCTCYGKCANAKHQPNDWFPTSTSIFRCSWHRPCTGMKDGNFEEERSHERLAVLQSVRDSMLSNSSLLRCYRAVSAVRCASARRAVGWHGRRWARHGGMTQEQNNILLSLLP